MLCVEGSLSFVTECEADRGLALALTVNEAGVVSSVNDVVSVFRDESRIAGISEKLE